jgi:hypothetical protein
MAAFAALALAALLYPVVSNLSRWPLTVALRHAAAAPNCTAARAMGLAPAYRGEPGYYPQHDDDRDGIACEPWPHRSLSRDGGATYAEAIVDKSARLQPFSRRYHRC